MKIPENDLKTQTILSQSSNNQNEQKKEEYNMFLKEKNEVQSKCQLNQTHTQGNTDFRTKKEKFMYLMQAAT